MTDTFDSFNSAPIIYMAPIAEPIDFNTDFLISDGHHSESISAQNLVSPIWAGRLSSPQTLVVQLDAKPTLRFLLAQGVEVSRPVCIKTLGILASKENFPVLFEDLAEGMEHFEQMPMHFKELMGILEQKRLSKIARLECLNLLPFSAMENRGLPLDRSRWMQLVQTSISPKIQNSYGEGFLKFHDPKTGRIHANFDPLGASTGRVSSHHPNLQNLPKDERFHACIAPGGNRSLISADYAAFELRILAGLSKDPALIEAFSRDEDIHSVVASKIFGAAVSKKNQPDLRNRAKAVNFGLVYGMGPGGLAKRLEISISEAENLMSQYFETYPAIGSYLEESVRFAFEKGYSVTRLGRKLYHDLDSIQNDAERKRVERLAKNMPIQGCAADIAKLAFVHLYQNLKSLDAGMINMIHDEFVVECLDKDVDLVAEIVRTTMENAQKYIIPEVTPKVDVSIGKYWIH